MKNVKRSRRIIAGLMALLLVFQMMYSNGKITVFADTGEGADNADKDCYIFLVTEKQEAAEESGQQPDGDNTQPVPIQGAEIAVRDADSNLVGEALITNEEGKASLQVDKDTDISGYTYTVTEKTHKTVENIPMINAVTDTEIEVTMEPRYEYTITGAVTVSEGGNDRLQKLEGAVISFGEGENITTVQTDEEGEFTVNITYAKEQTQMFWKAEKTGYESMSGNLQKGEEKLDISMTAYTKKSIKVNVVSGEEDNRKPVQDAQVTLTGYGLSEAGSIENTDENGIAVFSDIYVKDSYFVTVKKAGYVSCTQEITQQALETAAGNEAECTVTLQELGFEKTGDLSVAWNEGSFKNELQIAEGTIEPQYSILGCTDEDGNSLVITDYAEIDASTGEITLKDLSASQTNVILPVTLTIRAVNSGDGADQTLESASYELTINKAEQTLQWNTNLPDDSILYYGKENVFVQADASYQGKGAVTYEVTEKNNGNEYVSIGTEGRISYLKEVPVNEEIEVEVKAVKAEDGLYKGTEDVINFRLKRKSMNGTGVMLKGFKKDEGEQKEVQEVYLENGGNGWFSGDSLEIKKENCKFSADISTGNWEDRLLLSAGDVQADGTYQKSFYLQEEDGSITEQVTVSGIKWDRAAPEDLKISYSESVVDELIEKLTFGYYNAPVKVTISAKDTESGVDYIEWRYICTEDEAKGEYNKIEPTQEENGVVEVTFEVSREDSMKIDFNVYDKAGNVANYTDNERAVVLDKTPPKVTLSYDNNTVDYSEGANIYYSKERTAKIQIEEKNFNSAGVDINVSARDISGNELSEAKVALNGNEILLSELAERMKQQENWSKEGDKYWAYITYSEDAYYHFDIQVTDFAQLTSSKNSEDFGIDQKAPEDLEISYSKEPLLKNFIEGIRYYQDEVEITLKAKDISSGIDTITWQYLKEAQTSDKNLDSRQETISSDQITYSDDGKTATAKIRLTAKEAEQYRGNITFFVTDKVGNKSAVKDDGTRIVVDNIAPTMEIMGIPDIPDAEQDGKQYVKKNIELKIQITEANFYKEDVRIEVNKEKAYCSSWNHINGTDTWIGSLTLTDGEYEIMVEYQDRSTNQAETYTSPVLVVDTKEPVIDITYDNNTAVNDSYYKENRTATIQVTEQNFISAGVTVNASAKDSAGNEITDATVLLNGKEISLSELSKKLKESSSWSNSGTKHTASVTYMENAHYNISIQVRDIAGNSSKEAKDDFCIDKTKPYDLEISYSKPLLERVLEGITFGYYQSSVEITFTAKDDDTGIETLNWQYTKEYSSSTKNLESTGGIISSDKLSYSNQGKTVTAKVRLTAAEAAQYRGNLTFSVTDRAGNVSSIQESEHEIVVDNIAPTVTVDYVPCNQAGEKAYFNQTAVLNFHVEEANFYKEDVVIKVNGTQMPCSNWTRESGTDIWNGSISLTSDGDYRVTVEYKDRSSNQMTTYTSPILVVDMAKPVIAVTYDNNQVIYSENGNAYFDKARTATIQITDKNFNAEDVEAVVTAVKSDGTAVEIADYKNYLKQAASWQKNGDVNTATITYATDANYTFDISYTDMAKNTAENYGQEHFTVDTGMPENLKITYSDSILETVMENMSFGFYNAKVTVTVTAEDEAAGINHFVYSYKNAENVSGVNGQLLDQVIGKDQITYSNGGKTATAQFTIPKSELDENNQFNGVVEVHAVDNSGNQTDTTGNRRIVVDNIAPGAEVTYNQPTYSANGIDYYAEEVQGQITITEANFQAEDVEVTATKNGAPYALNVSWSDVSADIHNGSFHISEDGDYQISVNYQDKSGNIMTAYQSNQLTIDSTAPTITVEKIANGAAYNEETIGFKIMVDDVNFDVSSFQPALTAVVYEKERGFSTKDYSELGTIESIEEGKTYAYVIENIPEDAIYTLSCTVKDLSLNEMSEMAVAESGNELMESIMFSVNRNGSTFMMDDNTRSLVEHYYVTGVEADVVLQEINCDPISEHEVMINGERLLENTQYRIENRQGESTWYQYNYIIDKSVFEEEGSYAVVVASTDKAENVAYSDMKNVEAAFVVDRTEPIVIVSGLAENGRYQVEKQKVNVIPTDDGGKIESLEISIYDSNDKLISNAVSGNGEELLESMEANGGRVTFEIPQGVNQEVSIICTDAAGNVYEKRYKNITVSTEWYIMLLANRAVLYGGIAGIVLSAAAVAFGVNIRRRRKTK